MPHSAAAELVEAVAAVGAAERLTALAVGAHNPAQMSAVRSRLIQKALHAAVAAARYALPPPPEPAVVHGDQPPPGQKKTDMLPTEEHAAQPDTRTLRQARSEFERQFLAEQLAAHKGNVSALARTIGVERSALGRKLDDLGVAKRPVIRRKPKA